MKEVPRPHFPLVSIGFGGGKSDQKEGKKGSKSWKKMGLAVTILKVSFDLLGDLQPSPGDFRLENVNMPG